MARSGLGGRKEGQGKQLLLTGLSLFIELVSKKHQKGTGGRLYAAAQVSAVGGLAMCGQAPGPEEDGTVVPGTPAQEREPGPRKGVRESRSRPRPSGEARRRSGRRPPAIPGSAQAEAHGAAESPPTRPPTAHREDAVAPGCKAMARQPRHPPPGT